MSKIRRKTIPEPEPIDGSWDDCALVLVGVAGKSNVAVGFDSFGLDFDVEVVVASEAVRQQPLKHLLALLLMKPAPKRISRPTIRSPTLSASLVVVPQQII